MIVGTGRKITGKIVSGVGQGAFFTRLDWFQKQCREKFGFEPFPGTLNLEIQDKDLPVLEKLDQMQGVEILPADPAFCSAKAFPVSIGGVAAIIIMPDPSVRVHARNVVEIIAGVGLKETLGIDDGDPVELTVGDYY